MILLTLLVILVIGLNLGFIWDQSGGSFTIIWLGYEISGRPQILALATILFVWSALTIAHIRHRLSAKLLKRRWRRAKTNHSDAEKELLLSFSALAAGDADAASRHSQAMFRKNSNATLKHLIDAHIASLRGDTKEAQRHTRHLLSDENAAFLANRLLAGQALTEKREIEGIGYIQNAAEIRPDSPWVLRRLLDIQAREGRWDEALATLKKAGKNRTKMPEDKMLEAVLWYEKAKISDEVEAAKAVQKAVELGPSLTPAIILQARYYHKAGKHKKWPGLLALGWRALEHPNIPAFITQASNSPQERYRIVEQVCASNSDASTIAIAQAAADSHMTAEAKRLLKTLNESSPFWRQACLIFSQISTDQPSAMAWQQRAQAMHLPEQCWTCQSCLAPSSDWFSECRQCRAFASARWRHNQPGQVNDPPLLLALND